MLNLSASSLDWALEHATQFGDTDVFPLPFEFQAVRHCWQDLRTILTSQDVLNWTVRPHRVALSPKSQLGFRVVTQLDPLDFLVYSALVREICEDIESRRVPTQNAVVFSYRCKPSADGSLFDRSIGYSTFTSHAEHLLEANAAISHVALTDIADFYPRIYHHRLENALHVATKKTNHVKAIMGLLKGWNGTETFGVPVGSAPTRLLAEATLIDVDESLLAHGIRFSRFNDDYRIFATSYTEGYRHLTILADVLHRNHGLTLQKEKTHILEAAAFRKRYLSTPALHELQSLRDRFDELATELGLVDSYEPISYDDLDDKQKGLVDSLNLTQILNGELNSRDPDLRIVGFAVRRFAQLNDDSPLDSLLDNLELLHPIFPEIVRFILKLKDLCYERRWEIGSKILSLLKNSVVSELSWHRMWALEMFANSTEWNHSDRFVLLLAETRDLLARRSLICALGQAGQNHWFQSQWRTLFEESPWPRRALILAASCMPADARKHWYRSIEDRLDPLELAVMKWARANPLCP